MSDQFTGDPYTLRREGSNISDQSGQFNSEVEKIYSTVQDMMNNDYISPAAKAIGAEILKKRDTLNKITSTINSYGEYNTMAGNTVERNEENIIDNYVR